MEQHRRKGKVTARRRRRGQSLVEMALILPVLLLLVAAAADFGRAFNSYIVINNAAREGARFAARYDHTDTINGYILCAVYQEAAASEVDLGHCTTPGDPVPADPAIAVVTIDPAQWDSPREAGKPITVTVNYTITTIFTGLVGLDTIPMHSQNVMVMFGSTQEPEP